MSDKSTIHRLRLELADADRGVYETLQITAARHPSESAERLAGRLLAYALCYQEGIAFGRGVSSGDEPDLWLRDPDGRVRLWVEVGQPEAERLLKAARHSERVRLYAYGPSRRWWENEAPRLAAGGVETVPLDPAFIAALAAGLARTMKWNATVSGGVLYLDADGVARETTVGG